MAADRFDSVVIGAGQGGDPLARALAGAGRKTAIVERAQIGGTCVNTGCTPTKTMIASARAAYAAGRAAQYGVSAQADGVDLETVRRRKRDIVESFRRSGERRIEATKDLALIRGEAAFLAPHRLAIAMSDGSSREIAGEQIFINTGARPLVPKIDGLDTVPFLDYTTIEELESAPEHLLILGGSYVALEFGQMFLRFGSRVTVIEKAASLVEREDEDVAEEIATILGEDGIEIFTASTVTQVEMQGESIRLTVETPQGVKRLHGSHLLVATGRTPNTDRLDLQKAGIDRDEHGFVRVDERLATSAPGIWALGDVTGGPQFTHISYDDFRILEANLLKGGSRSTKERLVPYVMFLDPQLGRVGLTEREARAEGRKIRVAKMPMSEAARAIETDETRGFMKAVVDEQTERILGAAILGIEGGEIMAVLETAMLGNLPWTALRDGIFAHPTLAESLNNLFMTLD